MADKTTLTRSQLHEAVWATPIMHLAARFGISGNGLSKICARLDVPCPPRGWCAKKAAGHTLKIPASAEAEAGIPLKVAISASPNPDEGPRQAIVVLRDDLGTIAVPSD